MRASYFPQASYDLVALDGPTNGLTHDKADAHRFGGVGLSG